MQKIRKLFSDAFFLVGERLAIIAIFIVTGLLLLVQSPTQAFSQTPPIALLPTTAPTVTAMPTPTEIPPTMTPTPSPPTPTATPTLTATPTMTPAPTADPNSDAIWDQVAACESNGNWSDDTGNGYYGGLQFSQGAWNSTGGSGNPASASRDEQIMRAKILQARRGWGAWGGCAAKLGLE